MTCWASFSMRLMLLPIYLQTLLDYPAFNRGLALSPRGVGSLATTPLAATYQ